MIPTETASFSFTIPAPISYVTDAITAPTPAGYRQEHDFRNYRYDKRGKTDTGI